MPDDQNQPQNPILEENSYPPSSQEPTESAPENTTIPEESIVPPEVPEAARESTDAILVIMKMKQKMSLKLLGNLYRIQEFKYLKI